MSDMIEYGCHALTADWCAVYQLVVGWAVAVAEFFGQRLWEDGSWGQVPGPSGCLRWLGWGCT